ncbi:MAG: hypothetical protein GC151_18395 [Betaproteobacteria bacterium]|nr:hypothetical protein [Betaproteobacteria bacterium]
MRAFAGTLFLTATACASAQVTGSVALYSDYRHRGVSLSEGDPSAQATLAYDHPAGVFAGASVNTVKIEVPYTDTKVRTLYYAGIARELVPAWAWELGVLRYTFPGSRAVPSWDYTEWFIGVTHDTSSLRVFQSPDYFGEGGRSLYVDANHGVPLRGGVSFVLHLGHLSFRKDYLHDSRRAPNSRFDAMAGLSYQRSKLRVDAGIAGTTRVSDDCLGEPGHCRFGPFISVVYSLP